MPVAQVNANGSYTGQYVGGYDNIACEHCLGDVPTFLPTAGETTLSIRPAPHGRCIDGTTCECEDGWGSRRTAASSLPDHGGDATRRLRDQRPLLEQWLLQERDLPAQCDGQGMRRRGKSGARAAPDHRTRHLLRGLRDRLREARDDARVLRTWPPGATSIRPTARRSPRRRAASSSSTRPTSVPRLHASSRCFSPWSSAASWSCMAHHDSHLHFSSIDFAQLTLFVRCSVCRSCARSRSVNGCRGTLRACATAREPLRRPLCGAAPVGALSFKGQSRCARRKKRHDERAHQSSGGEGSVGRLGRRKAEREKGAFRARVYRKFRVYRAYF